MVDWGVLSKVVNAQNVTLSLGGNNVVSLFNSRLTDQSVLDRRNTRSGAVDTPSFAIIEIIADAVLDNTMYIALQGQRVLTSRGALPNQEAILKATAISDSDDDFTVTVNYTLRGLDTVAVERGRYEATLTMRINGAIAVS